MSTILEMQIDELQEELDAIKAINQKLQLEKNALKEKLALYGVSQQRELLKAYDNNISSEEFFNLTTDAKIEKTLTAFNCG